MQFTGNAISPGRPRGSSILDYIIYRLYLTLKTNKRIDSIESKPFDQSINEAYPVIHPSGKPVGARSSDDQIVQIISGHYLELI